VWTLTKGAQRLACVLRDDGAVGCEAQLLRDGAFYKGRRFATRAQALAHSARVRLRLEREGWTIGADVTG
jgi:hypothetical protein